MTDHDDLVWKALADPIRRELLDLLRDDPATTGALVAHFDQTRFGVMKHLDVLEAAKLITTEKRGRERFNFINAVTLATATARWLSPFQKTWGRRLASLARQIEQETAMQNLRMLDIRQELVLLAPREKVFSAITREVDQWWDAQYRQAGAGSKLKLKPELGAELVETNEHGHAVIWGRVEEVRVPDRIYFSGRFAVVGALAGRVHFDLAEEGRGKTELTLTHQAMGAISDEAMQRFGQGWSDLLTRCLTAHVSKS